ncbi:MAG TPA: SRPBCC family protein [Marmoricola sp.]|nr:SRPBCC family protein [Marmoricola sp.]
MRLTIHIDAPVHTVYEFMKDPARWQDLMETGVTVDEVRTSDETAYLGWHYRLLGLPMSGFDLLTDMVPDRHITDRSSSALVGNWDWDFEPEGAGTKLTMEHHPRSIFRVPPVRNVIEFNAERMSQGFLPRVKERLEKAA